MKKSILICIISLFCETSFSQATFFYFPRQENSAVTSAKMEAAKEFVKKAYEAYNQKDLKKTKYYLDQSERNGYTSAGFYYLLGQWCYDKGVYSSAKRYWMRGYRKSGCWECKELVTKMKLEDQADDEPEQEEKK